MINTREGGNSTQKAVEHLALGTMCNMIAIQIKRYKNLCRPKHSHKLDVNGVLFASERVAEHLKVKDNEVNREVLTAEEREMLGDNIVLNSTIIHRFCRLVALIPPEKFVELTKLILNIEKHFISFMPEDLKKAYKSGNL